MKPSNDPPAPAPTPPPGRSRGRLDRLLKFFRRRGFLFYLGIALALPLGTLATLHLTPPAYRFLKRQRALAMVPRIEAALQATEPDLETARDLLQAGLTLSPDVPELNRIAARLLRPAHPHRALRHWQTVLASSHASDADRLEAAQTAQAAGQPGYALRLTEELIARQPSNPDYRLEMARALQRSFRPAQAVNELQTTLREHPDHIATRHLLGEILLRAHRPETVAAGKRALWDLAVTPGSLQQPALHRLLESGELTIQEMQALRAQLAMQEQPTFDHLFIRTRIEAALNPDQAGALSDNLLAQGRDRELAEFIRAASWCLQNGQAAAVVRSLDLDTARTNRALMALRVDALGTLRNWQGIDELRASIDSTQPRSAHLVAQYQVWDAVRLHEGGNTDAAGLALAEALKSGRRRPGELVFVARAAEKLGFTAIALDAWQTAITVPQFSIEAATAILRLEGSQPDLVLQLIALERLHGAMALAPGDIQRLGYLLCLLRKDHATAAALFQNLAAGDPDNPRNAVGLAFAAHARGDSLRALQHLEAAPVDPTVLEPAWQAACAAIFAANQKRESARRIVRSLPPGSLRAQEQDLVRDL